MRAFFSNTLFTILAILAMAVSYNIGYTEGANDANMTSTITMNKELQS